MSEAQIKELDVVELTADPGRPARSGPSSRSSPHRLSSRLRTSGGTRRISWHCRLTSCARSGLRTRSSSRS